MRVLHVGNIANNGYINTKLLRRAAVEADVIFDERHILSRPEWEDAPLLGAYRDYDPLEDEARRVGWERPEWLRPARDLRTASRFKGDLPLHAVLRVPRPLVRTHRRLAALYAPLERELGRPLTRLDVTIALFKSFYFQTSVGALSKLERQYHVLQAYATHSIFPLLLTPKWPYVAFEHGTMRDIPFEDTWRGRLLALSYRQAAKVIITNADVVEQARLLGLENYVFIPHPLDETKYTPGPSELRAELEGQGFDFVLLSPSRHDWAIKGTDRLLRAFAELVHSQRRKAVLLLFDWGQEVGRSRALVEELGIEPNVRWSRPLPKLRLIDAYRAADVVLDQFLIGTFGAVAPEAMACGCPVVMAFRPELHTWCFPELPPVVDARTTEDIHGALVRLAEDAARREALGWEGRAWIERHHGWRLVVDRHLAIYEELGAGSAG
jgi:glycosyltransferase involved in cell wall biosynthesis